MDRFEHRVVVKIGTNTLTGGGLEPDQAYLDSIADQVVELQARGYEVLLVSSGAIGCGMGVMDRTERVREVRLRQALAAIGQPRMVAGWERAFSRHGVHVAQLLLTYDALRDRSSFLNLRNATETLLEMGVVPVVNENDTVATDEIQENFGDNDRLSAYVAGKARAARLVILSDVDGLYTHPPSHPDAEHVPVVEEITEEIHAMAADKSGSVTSRGGMRSKLEAARIATEAGAEVTIAHGRTPDVLLRILEGQPLGTRFLAQATGSEKKRWLAIAKAQGRIHVDPGALKALEAGGHLLPAGITGVDGSFPPGSVVEIVQAGQPVGKAVSTFSAKELEVAKGHRSAKVRELLGREGSCNVTRKNEVLLQGNGSTRKPEDPG